MNTIKFLKQINQEHLIKYKSDISYYKFLKLKKQIKSTNFSYLEVLKKANTKIENKKILPLKPLNIEKINKNQEKFAKIGLETLNKQDVGVVILAGGMGTRLGFKTPKGMINIGINKEISLFELQIKNILKVVEQCKKPLPIFIMTSNKNHKQTIKFFKKKNYFNYNKNYIVFFKQEEAPCTDFKGKVLLEEKHKISTSPNGNGNWFNCLLKNKKCKNNIKKYNIKWFNLIGIDNALQKIVDPIFIGATISGNYDMACKVVKKINAEEKVGLLCYVNNKPAIVEYMDINDKIKNLKDKKGNLIYNNANIVNFLFNINTLYKISKQKLPIHIVKKCVDCIDINGEKITPTTPNAYKFEYLSTDLVKFSKRCLAFEVDRKKEFAPIKQKTGLNSLEEAQKLLIENGFDI